MVRIRTMPVEVAEATYHHSVSSRALGAESRDPGVTNQNFTNKSLTPEEVIDYWILLFEARGEVVHLRFSRERYKSQLLLTGTVPEIRCSFCLASRFGSYEPFSVHTSFDAISYLLSLQ